MWNLEGTQAMKSRRGKRSEPFWSSIVMRKWLNIKPKVHEFSEDEVDMESEDDDARDTRVDPSFTTEGSEVTYSTQVSAKDRSSRRRRRKSETLRVQYITSKDVRVMIGTWNVAGRVPSEELELDEWLFTREPADIYILGFQEVVPLNAGNVLGAEDSRPIPKWESIIRRTLNNNNSSSQLKTLYKSYSAPPSQLSRTPLLNNSLANKVHVPDNHAFQRDDQSRVINFGKNCQWNRINSTNCPNKFDWPEYSLDTPLQTSGTKLRRVLIGSQGISFGWLEESKACSSEDLALNNGLKRAYQSLGNLGMLWSEQQDSSDVLESLKDISDKSSEDDPSAENVVEKNENEGSGRCLKFRPRFVRVVSKQMVGIYISVWVYRRLRRHINNLKVSPVGVGLMGYMGNKGSVSVSMSLFQTRLCFVCSHLTSGHKEGDQQKRNSDVHDILQRTRFSSMVDADQPQTIPSHDRIFWFGDLNYRLNMPDAEVRELVAMKQWNRLMNYDQLTNELRSGHTFDGWKEGLIDFPPTYKYERNSNRYAGENAREGEKRRSPACFVRAYDAELSPDYYSELCPLAEDIVRQNVEAAVYRDPNLAAALLRLHFHDCFVLGCDASVLLDSTIAIVSEKTAVPNLNSLRGFEVIDQIKHLLEEACPLTVSCADILAIVARDAVVLRGGPSWEVYLGRKDSLKASVAAANQMIPAPNSTLEVLITNFAEQGLDIVDLVALSGSHTIGRSRCTSFKGRLYGQLAYEEPPFSYEGRSHTFRRSLQSICPQSGRDNDLVPLDIKTSRRFDNQYYLNLLRGFGLLQSDEALLSYGSEEESVIDIVWAYAHDQELFFRDFAKSMIKMGSINVLTGSEGEIRENCRYLNV